MDGFCLLSDVYFIENEAFMHFQWKAINLVV